MRSKAVIVAGILYCVTTTCCYCEPVKAVPAIQNEMVKAGEALVRMAGDSWTNILKNLKGEQVPVEVQALEKTLGGDRIKAAQQLAYFMKGANTNETCGYASIAIFAYFNFTTQEIERATSEITASETSFPQGIVKEMLWMAQQQHPTNASTVLPKDAPSGKQ